MRDWRRDEDEVCVGFMLLWIVLVIILLYM